MQFFHNESDLFFRLNFCVLMSNDYLFCWFCFDIILKWYLLKYFVLNIINVFFCQYYSCALQNLTFTEKCLIVRSHSIVSVLKLCFNDTVNSLTYNQLHDHVIVLLQNSDFFLNILFSAELKLCEKINVIWFDDRFSTIVDLKSYLKIWKFVVYWVLQWFWLYNKLYNQIMIN